MKIIVTEINPLLAALYRYLLASVILSIIFFSTGRKIRILKEDRIYMIIMGIFGVSLYFIFENVGVKHTTTANVALILATIPVFTLILENIKNKNKSTKTQIIGVMLSVIGIALIVLVKDKISLSLKNTFGDMMVLLSSLSWVIYTFVIGKLKGKYDGIELTFYTSIFGTIFLIPILFFVKVQPVSNIVGLNLIYLALVCSGITFIMYLWTLKILGPVVVNTYINVQPIVSVLISIFVLKEKIYPMQLFGALIIMLGVYLVNKIHTKDDKGREKEELKILDEFTNIIEK